MQSVQYFAILHAVKEFHNTKNALTLVFYLRINVAVPCDIVCNKKHLSRGRIIAYSDEKF